MTLRTARIDFVLVFVGGSSPGEISERMGRVAELGIRHQALVQDMVSGLVVLTFGTHVKSTAGAENRLYLVVDLQRELSDQIKIVHGVADGHAGLLGSQSRLSYSFIVPHFDRMLTVLSGLQFGLSVEINPAGEMTK